jgi:hypothetical protein
MTKPPLAYDRHSLEADIYSKDYIRSLSIQQASVRTDPPAYPSSHINVFALSITRRMHNFNHKCGLSPATAMF